MFFILVCHNDLVTVTDIINILNYSFIYLLSLIQNSVTEAVVFPEASAHRDMPRTLPQGGVQEAWPLQLASLREPPPNMVEGF